MRPPADAAIFASLHAALSLKSRPKSPQYSTALECCVTVLTYVLLPLFLPLLLLLSACCCMCFSAPSGLSGEFESEVLRLAYSSLTTPSSIYDQHLPTGMPCQLCASSCLLSTAGRLHGRGFRHPVCVAYNSADSSLKSTCQYTLRASQAGSFPAGFLVTKCCHVKLVHSRCKESCLFLSRRQACAEACGAHPWRVQP